MSYSYFASDELARSLESNNEYDDVRSGSNVYQNTVTSAGERMICEASKSSIGSQSNPSVQTFSALDSNPATQTGMITGGVRLNLPRHTIIH